MSLGIRPLAGATAAKPLQDLDASLISTAYSETSGSCRHSIFSGDMSLPDTPAESQFGGTCFSELATPCAGEARLPKLQEEESKPGVGPFSPGAGVGPCSPGALPTSLLMASIKLSAGMQDSFAIDGARRIRRSSLTRPPSVKERVHKVEKDIEKVGIDRKRRSSRGAVAGISGEGASRSGTRLTRATSVPQARPGILEGCGAQQTEGSSQVPQELLQQACSPKRCTASESAARPAVCSAEHEAREAVPTQRTAEHIEELSATCSALARQLMQGQQEYESSLDGLRRTHAAELRRLELSQQAQLMQRDSEVRAAKKELHRVRSDARLQIAKARASCQRELADALGTATSLCAAISNVRTQLPQ